MNLEHRIAIVTGAASGMGRASAEALRQRGVRVIGWDRQETDTMDDFIVCDVSDAASIEQALRDTIERFGIPSICINCAGIAPARRMVGKDGVMPLDAFKQVIDVNLIGTFNVMRVVSDAMTRLPLPSNEEERGVIINTASVAAFEGQIGQTAYSASKGGVVAMTLPAARELAQFGIRVNTIAPGLIATPMLLGMPQEVQDSLSAMVPFPKRLGKPSEFAALVVHIIENPMINGEVIRLDGAIRMQPR